MFAARQRRQEISIRKVLGASATDISLLLSRQFMKPVLIAVVLATPLCYHFSNGWLQDFAWRVPFSWFYIGGACAVVVAIDCTVDYIGTGYAGCYRKPGDFVEALLLTGFAGFSALHY